MNEQEISEGQDHLNQVLERYMIALVGGFEPLDELGDRNPPKCFAFPGFVLDVDGRWIFVTAGHLLRKHMQIQDDASRAWVGLVWCHFVSDSQGGNSYPLDANSRHCFFECDALTGLEGDDSSGTKDYGLLPLTDFERQWLGSKGVLAFSKSDLKRKFDCDLYILLGVPTKLIEPPKLTEGGGISVDLDPIGLNVKVRQDLMRDHKGKWFIGEYSRNVDISLVGMSGGPLLGINPDDPGIACWVAGIQSHWEKEERLIFVCPIQTVEDNLHRASTSLDP